MKAFTGVAMSGGLDSSVAAALLAGSGEPIVGLSMLLWDHSTKPRSGRCCGSLDLGDARRVARQIGIPHYTLRMDAEFERQVVDPFVGDYAAGRTPSPCVRCNTFIKFDAFLERARALGARRIATGHYARVVEGPDGVELHRARDEEKDQSYFLFELRADQLEAAVFPLGEMTKDEVRGEARRRGLLVAEKGESMDLCFVDGDLGSFLGQRMARTAPAVATESRAEIVDREGRRLGAAAPYYTYTVGQRRGLGIDGGERLYVLEVLPAANQVVVGPRRALRAGGLIGERAHWIGPMPGGAIEASVRIRSRHAGVASRIQPLPGRRVAVDFAEPQEGVAPGQAAVFYDGTRVLGGCWITAEEAR
jgi:tRNA-specific 2-thiouridylase